MIRKNTMNTKRFTHIEANRHVNVSSSHNYTVEVYFNEAGVFKSYWYDPQMSGLICKPETGHFTRNVPRYVIETIETELRRLWSAGRISFFEYDQDGTNFFWRSGATASEGAAHRHSRRGCSPERCHRKRTVTLSGLSSLSR